MLCELFPQIRDFPVVKQVIAFLDSVWLPALVAALMALANAYGLELPVYWSYVGIGVIATFLARDMRALIPIACCSYCCISMENNPASNVEGSLFYQTDFVVQLATMIVIAAVLLVGRLVFRFAAPAGGVKLPKFSFGFLALGLSFVLGGMFSGYYSGRTAFFGFVEICCLAALYFYFYFTVDWKTVPKWYVAAVFALFGVGIFLEVVNIYLSVDVIVDGQICRGKIFTGWGHYNNMGCVMAMGTMAFLCLAAIFRHGWIFSVFSVGMMAGVVMTQSRGAILFAGITYVIGAILVLLYSTGRDKRLNFLVFDAALILFIFLVVLLRERLDILFGSMPDDFFEGNGRWPIYKGGIDQFFEAPAFGVGFYECHGFRWGNLPEGAFLPARYHNTYIQLIASGGVFAAIAYLFHRAQTVRLLLARPSAEKSMLAVIILALLLTSFVDCHFFNLGPGLLYSVVLIGIEGADLRDGAKFSAKNNKKIQNNKFSCSF